MLILDSTGISCERSGDALKLHVLAAYHPGSGVLAIARAEVTGFNVHDVTQGERPLIQGEDSLLLGDVAYDYQGLRVKAMHMGTRALHKVQAHHDADEEGGGDGLLLRQGEIQAKGRG